MISKSFSMYHFQCMIFEVCCAITGDILFVLQCHWHICTSLYVWKGTKSNIPEFYDVQINEIIWYVSSLNTPTR